MAIPATLHASLIARLDRLGPVAKEVAQIGAVIGREFSYELIQPVAQRPVRDLEIALDRLTNAGLLFCRGVPPHSYYLFKHALVQDAAYATLLRVRRQQLHAAIAAARITPTRLSIFCLHRASRFHAKAYPKDRLQLLCVFVLPKPRLNRCR